MSVLRVIVVKGCPAEHFGRLAPSLLAQDVGAPALLLAELADAAVLLGRHQRAASTIDLEGARARGLGVARRAGGGKAIAVAPGTLGVLLVVPPGGWPERLDAPKVLNRCVRGLLKGLAGGAAYFGRDFVAQRAHQVATVSQEGAPGGTLLFEALVATAAPLALPPGLSRAPVHDDPRAPGPPHATAATTAEALIAGWARALEAELLREADAPEPGEALDPPIVEDEEGFVTSGPVQVPIGFLEAWVRRDGDRIGAVRLRGDFIAPAFAVASLETALAGKRFDLPEIGPIIDAAFQRRGATIIGLRELRVIADAILACAR